MKPMLALEMEEKIVKFPCMVQPKLDGIRCLVYKKESIVFQSRQNKLFEPFQHLLPELESIFEKHPTLVLDGELYCHGLGFESVTSMVRRAKTRHPDVEKLVYILYDCIGEDLYLDRTRPISTLQGKVQFIETMEVTTRSQIEDAHTHYTGQGYEGIMIRRNGPYKHGRSKDLLKYKKFKDSEFLVVGHTVGTGAHAGTAIFICETNEKTFHVTMNGPLEKRREMLKQVGDYYGKYLTVKYQEIICGWDTEISNWVGFSYRLKKLI